MSTAVATIDHEAPPRLPALQAGGQVRAIVPQDFDGAWRIANAVTKAGMAPRGLETAEKAMVAIMHGLEVGMTPMNALQSIAVVNGRPTIWGDGAIGLARGSGLLEWMKESFEGEPNSDDYTAVCLVKRKGEPEPVRGEFSVADAKKAGLWSKAGPWQQYPKRMLRMRARAFALRDGFADVLRGLSIKEEVEDFHHPMQDVTPPSPPSPPPAPAIEPPQAEAEAEQTTEIWDEAPAAEGEIMSPPSVPSAPSPAAPPAPNPGGRHEVAPSTSATPRQSAKPAGAADPGEIPGFLDRRKPKTVEATAADVFDAAEWLNGLEGAFSGCEDMSELFTLKKKLLDPYISKALPPDRARAEQAYDHHYDRIVNAAESEDPAPREELTIIGAG